MACNCGKNKKPTGFGQVGKTQSQQSKQRDGAKKVNPKPAGYSSRTQTFELKSREGRTQTFGSRLEAEAARIRSGGGIIRSV